MNKVVAYPGLAFIPPEPHASNEAVIRLLEQVLQRARMGRMQAIAAVYVDDAPDGTMTTTDWAPSEHKAFYPSSQDIVWGLRRLEHDIFKEEDRFREDVPTPPDIVA